MYPERSSIVTSSTKTRACSEQERAEPEELVPEGDLLGSDCERTSRTAFSHSDRTLRKPEKEYASIDCHGLHRHSLSTQGHCFPKFSFDNDWKSEGWLGSWVVSKAKEKAGQFFPKFSEGCSLVHVLCGSSLALLQLLLSKRGHLFPPKYGSSVTPGSGLTLFLEASTWLLCFSWLLEDAFMLQYVNLGGCKTGDLERLRRCGLVAPLRGFLAHLDKQKEHLSRNRFWNKTHFKIR